jgi:hypothetical protein
VAAAAVGNVVDDSGLSCGVADTPTALQSKDDSKVGTSSQGRVDSNDPISRGVTDVTPGLRPHSYHHEAAMLPFAAAAAAPAAAAAVAAAGSHQEAAFAAATGFSQQQQTYRSHPRDTRQQQQQQQQQHQQQQLPHLGGVLLASASLRVATQLTQQQ